MSTNRDKVDLINLANIIHNALEEDMGLEGDITSISTIEKDQVTNFVVSNREDLVLCGLEIIEMALKTFDTGLKLNKYFNDGDYVQAGQVIADGIGNARAILASERIMLNLLQHLCGISSITRKFVEMIKHTKAIIRDTRKTLPGLRDLQKYAVKIGGGENHRSTLDEMILIKDNHIALSGGVENAFNRAKLEYPNKIIEIECDTLEQVRQALLTKCDLILLDNMSVEQMEEAVKLSHGKVKLEASGGVNLSNVKAIAETGVDYIAIGSLTHSVKASDIGLDIFVRGEY
jgi:nicotinate-nucleotide pyrophosphorylase (carboxylating)